MDIQPQINTDRLPNHVAIIMDGNGRWAKQKGLARVFGHRNGVKAVRQTVEAASEIGLKVLTLYAFSTENWKRPKKEIDALMNILIRSLKKELSTFQENDIKLQTIGQTKNLPLKAQKELQEVIDKTENNSSMILNLALSYGSREEIVNTIKNISKKIVHK